MVAGYWLLVSGLISILLLIYKIKPVTRNPQLESLSTDQYNEIYLKIRFIAHTLIVFVEFEPELVVAG